ncbi:MAG: spore maturation protein [Clostridia bacterium]|nr:spore maturation protein [Clostridia bacterium]
MKIVAEWLLPVMIAFIVLYGLVKKVPIWHSFLSGAAQGLTTAVGILPTLVGLVTAVAMFQGSGIMDWLSVALAPLTKIVGLPSEVVPLMLIHPISGGGATAVLSDLLSRYGADSHIGRVASVMCGSDETTFYAITVYYGSVGVSSIGHTLPAALLADLAVIVLSGVGVQMFLQA